ncbi:hypothetical protein BH20ACT11_BH20ACT11_00610 [soil metagenome]
MLLAIKQCCITLLPYSYHEENQGCKDTLLYLVHNVHRRNQ